MKASLILFAFGIMRGWQRLLNVFASSSQSKMQNTIEYNSHEYIENQHALRGIPFGKANMGECGCEIIAVYNALYSFGINPVLPDLIHHFQHDGMMYGGRFGTSPKAIKDFFYKHKELSLHVECSSKESNFDRIAVDSQASIITFFNDASDISKQIHTVCLTKAEGGFYAHNLYCDGKACGPFMDISTFLSSVRLVHVNRIGEKTIVHNARGIYIIGLHK